MSKDPRLIAIAFLAELDRVPDDEQYGVTPAYKADFGNPWQGLSKRRYAQMLMTLVSDGYVNDVTTLPSLGLRMSYGDGSMETTAAGVREQDLRALAYQKNTDVRISHRGRIYLWEQRQRLLSEKQRDKSGRLWDGRYWLRDLELQLAVTDAERPLSVVFFDLDHFKSVNDTLGHAEGDEVLATTFDVANGVFGNKGELYRYGGDEVGVILPGVLLDDAVKLAELLRAKVKSELSTLEQVSPTPTVSVGVASFSAHTSADVAHKFVDEVQYKAKHGGKDKVESAAYDVKP